MGKLLLSALILMTSSLVHAKVDADLETFFKQVDPNYKTQAEREAEAEKTHGYFARTITLDTRDQEACRYVEKGLKEANKIPYKENICELDEENPYTSVVIMMEADEKYDPGLHFQDIKDPKYANLAKNMKGLTAMSGLTSLAIFVLPESISKWDRSKILNGNFGGQWEENVKAGPVMDEDPWPVNFIGHPYSGAAYYTVARHSGFSRLQSFGISVLLSTFYWEYGVEAVSEVPSLQDLIITPIIGSLMGEAFMQVEEYIDDNDGELFGSEIAGNIAKTIIDPIGSTTRFLEDRYGLDNLDIVVTPQVKLNTSNTNPINGMEQDQYYFGFKMEIRF